MGPRNQTKNRSLSTWQMQHQTSLNTEMHSTEAQKSCEREHMEKNSMFLYTLLNSLLNSSVTLKICFDTSLLIVPWKAVRVAMAGACPRPGPRVGEWIEVQWPCQDAAEAVAFLWFRAFVKEASGPKENGKQKFLLRFEDAEETWNSLRKVQWRSLAKCPLEKEDGLPTETIKQIAVPDETVPDETGFVYSFEIEESFLLFCDSLHARRDELGDKSRGDERGSTGVLGL